MAKKDVPVGIKVISVLYYIGAVLTALFGVLSFVGAGMMGSVLGDSPLAGMMGSGLFVFLGIVFIAFGVLYFFIGRGLWLAQNWARIVAGIFAVIGLLYAILALIGGAIGMGILYLVVNGLIGWYLFFNEDVKDAFA